MTLLTREDFKQAVFSRDKHCAFCEKPAVDAHHILDRKLFPDGGYYIDNGVAVCEQHHIDCELGRITPIEIYAACKIEHPALPPGFDPDVAYTKWGQKMEPSRYKFPRTPHLPWSPGFSGDDLRLANIERFECMREIVVTEKLDGENTTIYSDGYLHARSINGTDHPWQAWVKRELAAHVSDIPAGWRICGENVYGIHSIEYSDLPSAFFIFSIIDENNKVLGWDYICDVAALLDLKTVPVLYRGSWDEDRIKSSLPAKSTFGPTIEGYVVRNASGFPFDDYGNNVAKYVRKGHVQTDERWTKNWKPATIHS